MYFTPLKRNPYDSNTFAMPAAKRTYCQRGYLSRNGFDRLHRVLVECSKLYNAELDTWRRQYRETGKSDSLFDRTKAFTVTRNTNNFWQGLSVYVGRGVLCRAERAKRSFYRRVKKGSMPGYPRRKPPNRYRTIQLEEVSLAMIGPDRRGYALRIKGLPVIRLRTTRNLPPKQDLKSIRITYKGRRVTVSLVYAEKVPPLPHNPSRVGIDLGVLTRITTSDGQEIERRRPDREDTARKHRRLSACKKGSRRYRKRRRVLANAHDRAKVKDRGRCHEITTKLVRRYGFIALEDLDQRKMTRSGDARKRGLNRSILEQAWGRIVSQLVYKAEWANRKLVFVNPSYTTQLCSGCGAKVKKSLQERTRRCGSGLVLHRDHNAAINILHRALGGGTLLPAVGETA